jgi:Large polyvalent protein associated domain 38
MSYKFDSGKYKNTFDDMFGSGSFESGLKRARKIGQTKAQAGFEKEEANRRIKEAERAYKEAIKEAERAEKEEQKRRQEEAEIAAGNEASKRAPDLTKNEYYNKMNEAYSYENQRRMEQDRRARGVSASDLSDEIIKNEKKAKKKKNKSKKNKDERDGILGFLDDTVGRASKKAQEWAFGEEFVDKQAKQYAKSDNEQVKKMQKSINKKADTKLEKSGDIIGNVFGIGSYLVPGQGAANLTSKAFRLSKATSPGAKLAEKVAVKGTDSAKQVLGKKVAKLGAEGTGAGLLLGLGDATVRESLSPNERDWKDHLKMIGLETAGGAVLDPLLTLGGKKLMDKGLSRLPNKKNDTRNLTLEHPKLDKDSSLKNELKPLDRKQVAAGLDVSPDVREKYINSSPEIDPGLIKVKPLPEIDHKSGNFDSFRSKVNRTPQKENKFLETFKNLRTQFVDDMAPLERLEKGIRGAIPTAENSLYKTARLIKGSPERAHEMIRTKLTPILQNVKQLGFNEKDLGDYALAVHARDVNAKGMNSGFTNAEIEDVITKLGTPEMEQVRKQLVQVSDDVLRQELGQNQILTDESMNAMREKWPNYMPLFRAFDDDKVGFAGGMSNALANASNPIKRLEGSSRDVIDPIESMVKNIFQATNQADRNKIGLQLSRLASEDQSGMLRKLNPEEKVDRKNVVSVMENGEKVKYEVPPEIYKTITNMDKESSNTLIRILQAPASTLRAGATLTPEFSLRNPLRDVVQAYVTSSSGFNPITDFPIGLWNAIFKGKTFNVGGREVSTGKWFNDFIESNGGYGNIVSMDRKLHRQAIENVLKEGNTPKFRNIVNPKSWLEVLRTIADVSETATKVGEYRAAIKKTGASREEAAYRARDLMDFARAGTSIREANKVVAFLNANIQGKSKLIRAIKEDPKGVTARAFKAVTAPTIGAYIAQQYMANDEQKVTIDDAPQWLKDTFYLVPVPGTNEVARIPKPFDLAPIFSNLVERSLDFVAKNDPEAFDNYAEQAISSYSVPTMLTGLSPIIEGMANYSFFKQGAIDPVRDQDVEYPDRYDINTSETAKLLGKGVNTLTGGEGAFKNFGSPRIIDNTIRGLTGGLGEYTVDAVDFVMDKTGIVNKEAEKPDKQINQQPLLRSFMVNQGSTGESVNKIYTLLDSLKKARGSSKQNEKDFPKEETYKEVKDVAKQISDISKEMRSIENDPDMSGKTKRKLLDKLNQERNEIAQQSVESLK